MEAQGRHLLLLLANGELSVWDVVQRSATVSRVFVSPLAGGMDVLMTFLQGDAGIPVVVLSDHTAYCYDLRLQVWLRSADTQFSLSEFASLSPSLKNAGVLFALQAQLSTQPGAVTNAALAADPVTRRFTSVYHLENLMAAAVALASPDEFRHWLRVYVRRIADEADVARLRELCDELLGAGSLTCPAVTGWQPTVLGLVKRDLLSETVQVMAKNRALQRLVQEYDQALRNMTLAREF